MASDIKKQDALNYHKLGQPGKIEITPTKILSSQIDLALAYSPGVAEPCKEISTDTDQVYQYTAKGNLVGVISNGTAVLGLGNIGPEASKPVMEGKAVLFKKFAGIDVFDLEINATDPEDFIRIVKSLEPTFGGINLEDIKAPESFKIEQQLKKEMNIPVMHDDQHGTAIISAAALMGALELVEKDIDKIRIVISGAGAAAISCANLYISLGARRENMVMLDSKGVIRKDRDKLAPEKAPFATERNLETLAQAMKGADMFLGLSTGNIVSADMLQSMNDKPVVFALANPEPEIAYDTAMAARDDLIMATGRSDHPNQVNNVLGFPYIFRGALDVRATSINEEMKLAAVHALAKLAKEPVPDMVNKAYGKKKIKFGPEYLIPKPLDQRLITRISPAVAQAAMETGVARGRIEDWEGYHNQLLQRIGVDQKIITHMISRAKRDPKRIVFAEADHHKILKAAQIVQDEGIGRPVLLGNQKKIDALIEEYHLSLAGCPILDPFEEIEHRERYGRLYYEKRKRKGVGLREGAKLMLDRTLFGAMMVECSDADTVISGLTKDYPKAILPALAAIGVKSGVRRVAGMYVLNTKRGTFFLADTTVNINPTVEELVEIIGITAEGVRFFGHKPRMAVLSYSNFGSASGEVPKKVIHAVEMAKKRFPELVIDGDIQANVALNPKILRENYPFSELANEGANTLIFPDLSSGNIAYKLLMEIGGAEAIGPILLGMKKPFHILQLGSSVREIVNMAAIAAVDAQTNLELYP